MTANFMRAAAAAILLGASPAFAGGSHGGGHHTAMMGEPAEPGAAGRTVQVVMHDNYYEPETISVKAGETIRFEIRNAGTLVHEFGIGTADRFEAHRPEMREMMRQGAFSSTEIMKPEMMHHSGNSVMVEPGEEAELVWLFPDGGRVDLGFACTVPGHYEAGMRGDFVVGHGTGRESR